MRITTAGIALLIAGVAIFVFTLVRLINGSALDPQTKVPGTVSAEIDAPGRYYVWDNHWTMFNGERVQYSADCPVDAQVVVHDSSGDELQFVPDASQNWSIGNNEKTSIGYVDVPAATALRLDVAGVGRERIVSVSNRTMKQELWDRLGGFGVGLIVGLIGIPIALLGLLVRRRPSTAVVDARADSHGRAMT